MAPPRVIVFGRGAGGPQGRPSGSRRPRWLTVVFLALLIVPVIEIAVIIAVGRAVGGWWTVGLLIAFSVVGAWLVRREGRRTWGALRTALRTGRMPARELADAGLVLVGGTLLLAPGFVTDAAGLFLILPFTRPLTRVWLQAVVARRLLGGFAGAGENGETGGEGPGDAGSPYGRGPFGQGPFGQAPPGGGPAAGEGGHGSGHGGRAGPGRTGGDDVVEGEIIDDDDPPAR